MEENYESFDKIIDPETNMNVPVESKVGQQVIKNYLECLKNGPDSSNIVSTKMYYRPKKSTKKESNKSTKESNKAQTPVNLGSVRGVCPKCNKAVYSTQERIKSSGDYYHDTCFKQ
jgi:hypothetical protein